MYYICPSKKVCFSVAEKCGVESILYLIGREENEPIPKNIWSYKTKYLSIYIPRGYKHIAIIRNPYNRLVSGFLDKCMTGNFYSLDICKIAMKYYKRDYNDSNRLNFKEFVNFIVQIPPKYIDNHFKPQTMNVNLYGAKRFDINDPKINDYLKNELGFKNNFDNYRLIHLYYWNKKHIPNAYNLYYNDYDIAEKRINNHLLPPKSAGIGFQGANIPLYEDFYTPEIKLKVYKYFINDFNILEYKQ